MSWRGSLEVKYFFKLGTSKIGKKGYECIMFTHFRYIPIYIFIYIYIYNVYTMKQIFQSLHGDPRWQAIFSPEAVARPVESAAAASIIQFLVPPRCQSMACGWVCLEMPQ